MSEDLRYPACYYKDALVCALDSLCELDHIGLGRVLASMTLGMAGDADEDVLRVLVDVLIDLAPQTQTHVAAHLQRCAR